VINVLLKQAISEKINISLNDGKRLLCSFACRMMCLFIGLLVFFPLHLNAQEQEQRSPVKPAVTNSSQIDTLTNKEHSIELPDTTPVDLASLTKKESLAGVYGSISSVGSDTLATLISLWSEQFKTVYPHVKFQIQASGSATAPQALTQGTATIGPMSRALTATEISRFTQKYGYPPTTLIVAVDAIAIYVEKNNPLQSLTLQEVDALFSVTRFCGSSKKIDTWTDIGVTKFGENREVLLYGRNSASGTYDLFKKQALCEGDFKATVNELPGSSSVVLSIASSVGGLGYAALGQFNENVKALSISTEIDGENDYIEPNTDNVTSGKYPFSRYLYIVVNKPPDQHLPVLERAFLTFILSNEGQDMVNKNGYYSISKELRDKQLVSILR
jgi:phosphate transport system substrate-binding protein